MTVGDENDKSCVCKWLTGAPKESDARRLTTAS
jgi:hypothetical protein